VDLWIEGRYARTTFFVNGFARRVDDYITATPTALPRLMPTSPMVVYQYVNGDATFTGAEAGASLELPASFRARLAGSLLRGDDATLKEPAPGVSPARVDASLRYEPTRRWFAEGTVRATAGQSRVSMTRGEMETPGWSTLDFQGGRELSTGVSLRVGVSNVLNRAYANHLNAFNPYTMMPVPEPGRVFFARVAYGF
jgi:iron complex outermembrane receptor protein